MWLIPLFGLLLTSGLLPGQDYFPPGALDRNPHRDEFKVNWYSKHLQALQEPSLWGLSREDPNAEVYRFLWLRSFHHPIAVRLILQGDGSGWLTSRITSGQGGYDPGKLIGTTSSLLNKAKTQSLLTAIESANIWDLSTYPDTNEVVGLDGAQWIIEGVGNSRCHIIDRWSPNARDPVRAIGILALKLGRPKIPSAEIY